MKTTLKFTAILIVVGLALAVVYGTASAQAPDPGWNWGDDSTVAGSLSGSGSTTGGNTTGTNSSSSHNTSGGGGTHTNNSCHPGVVVGRAYRYFYNYTTAAGVKMCRRWNYAVDDCGNLLYVASGGSIVPCPSGGEDEEEHVTNPCTINASMAADGSLTASCSFEWECKVKVPLPPSFIDVRPYPATLVRWPTALRFSGQGTTKDVCTVENAGSMRNLTLSLEFRPATGIVTITMPYLPVFKLTAPQMVEFEWQVPSHPAVGATTLASQLGGFFDELPGDFPAFTGTMKTPYDLFWKITFEKQDRSGNWRGYSFDGKLLPQDVRDTPALYFADLNGDGKADAWWDPNFVISRMDENNRTDNAAYERHWSYGELLPWAVREGQGQIGWP